MTKVLVIAPHADDESLGCGGTILKHINAGDEVHWLLVTGMSVEAGFSSEQINTRAREISKVKSMYGIKSVRELGLLPARLDDYPLGDVVVAISEQIKKLEPEVIYIPYRNDVHSDHQIVFDATVSSTKSFRAPFVQRLLAYETISETEQGVKPEDGGFRPNVFVDISIYLDKKLDILDVFESEMGQFPFPRSRKAIEALARYRGAQSYVEAAESFVLLKEIVK